METLIEKKNCLQPYQELIICIKQAASLSNPNKRPSYTSICQQSFQKLGQCVVKEEK
ncbi:unnamed protein product [Paramecium primaurelia]|uniref:Uncharacterized protein n=2 Tax=Paramecium TaxID=5884 RepID=A0A8S1U9D9_9CILI|nr:unnamed protein product [Paramecium primaurelia]CAD8160483.1 unnamed protein product [Paramecium pentaurelia]